MQSDTNGEEMMCLSAHLHVTFVCNRYANSQTNALHDKPSYSLVTPPHENYHQLTFEAHYITVLVEVEQSGDARWRASSGHHIHIHLYQPCQSMEWWISRKVCGRLIIYLMQFVGSVLPGGVVSVSCSENNP